MTWLWTLGFWQELPETLVPAFLPVRGLSVPSVAAQGLELQVLVGASASSDVVELP